MDKKMKDLEKKIGKVPKFFKELTVRDPEMYELVMKFEEHIWDDGALSRKTKKLIAISIAAALRDQHAVRAQLAGAVNLGVTKEEIERRCGLHSYYLGCLLMYTAKHNLMRL